MKIKDICTSVTDGSHNPPQGIEKSEYMMLSSKNIFDDEITFDEPRFLSEKDFEREHKRTQIAVGDVLLTIVGTVGRTAVVDEDMPAFALQRSVAVLHPKNDICLPRFLMYALRGKRTYIENRAKGVAQKGIYLKEVSDIDIYIPDISNQEIIINKLDKVNTIIKLRQEELLALDNLIKARFVEMFGDPRSNPFGFEKKRLKDTCKVITGNTPSRAIEEYYGDYIEWIKTDNIVSGILNPTQATESLSEKGMNVGRTVEKDSILMACIAGSIASIGRVCITDRTVAFNQQINAVVPEQYNILFLYVLFQMSKDYLVEDINMALKGILSKSKLEEKEFIIPPMDLQEQFSDFVKQVDKSKVAVQKALDETQMLFDSLMQEYFN